MRFSSDGSRLALWEMAGSRSLPTVYVWDRSAPQQAPKGLTAPVLPRATCTAFSPNNAALAVGYDDGTVLLWDLAAK